MSMAKKKTPCGGPRSRKQNVSESIFGSVCPNWMKSLPFWMRDALARFYRSQAHYHADQALFHRGKANECEAKAVDVFPETEETDPVDQPKRKARA